MSKLKATQGWVILVKGGNGRYRIGWDALFSSRSSSEEFVRSQDWTEQTKVVRGTLSANLV